MNKELKPCPFCGEIVSLDYSELTNKKHWYITCDCCGMMYQAVGCQRKDTKTGWNTRPIEDALTARIAELEADKERLNSCESALISMVNQFFYSKAGENIFRHSFMSAEEEAAEYLVEHGIARWVGKNKSAICFNEVQE